MAAENPNLTSACQQAEETGITPDQLAIIIQFATMIFAWISEWRKNK